MYTFILSMIIPIIIGFAILGIRDKFNQMNLFIVIGISLIISLITTSTVSGIRYNNLMTTYENSDTLVLEQMGVKIDSFNYFLMDTIISDGVKTITSTKYDVYQPFINKIDTFTHFVYYEITNDSIKFVNGNGFLQYPLDRYDKIIRSTGIPLSYSTYKHFVGDNWSIGWAIPSIQESRTIILQ